jgi:hypothetical protein
MRTVIGGAVRRQGQAQNLSAGVDHIDFPDVGPGVVVVPDGEEGTMWLTAPPPAIGHYDQDDVLDYGDGNNNNNATLVVLQDLGPSKYNVRKRT